MGDEVERLEAVDRAGLASAIALICGDPGLAEEALQEALVRAWQKVKAGDEVASWPAWVVTVALNHTRNHFRRLGRERSALRLLAGQLEPRQKELADRVASSVDLVRAMSKLTRREREVVSLHYRLDMSLSEIANAVNVEEGTVKTLLHRARARLLPLVADHASARLDIERRIG
ncbi:MAG: RNA polymerase sigma factor [Acidimicrobiales bacterium]